MSGEFDAKEDQYQPGFPERLAIRAALGFEDKLNEWRDPRLITQRAKSHLGRNLALTALGVALVAGGIIILPTIPQNTIATRVPISTPSARLGPEYSRAYADLIVQYGQRDPSDEPMVLKDKDSHIMFQQGIIVNYVDGLHIKVDDWAVIRLSRDPRLRLGLTPPEAVAVFLTEGDNGRNSLLDATKLASDEYLRLDLSQRFNSTFPSSASPTTIYPGALPVYDAIASVVKSKPGVDTRSIPPGDFSEGLSIAWIIRMQELSKRSVYMNAVTRTIIRDDMPLTVRYIDPDLIGRATTPRG